MRELEFWQDCLWFTCGLLPVQNWKEYNFKTIKALCKKKKKKVGRAIRDQSYSSLYLCGNTPNNCLAVLYDFMFFFFFLLGLVHNCISLETNKLIIGW